MSNTTSTITFSKWVHPTTNEKRIYINGTTRTKIYFTRSAENKFEFNSDALRPQPNTSSLWQRREKDRAAMNEALKAKKSIVAEPGFDALWEALSK